jgi:hypothetical protein
MGLVACAQGETLDPGGASGVGGGTAGSGGAAAGSGGSKSGTCDLGTSDPVCDNCINTTCFNSCDACASNQACLDLLSCIQGCDDTTCENTCRGQYAAGEAAFNAFIGETGCMTVSCETACGSSGCGLTSSDAVCDDCMSTRCFNECASCSNTPDCLTLLDCLGACTDATCENTCIDMYPNGYDPLMNLLGTDGCLDLQCTTECG